MRSRMHLLIIALACALVWVSPASAQSSTTCEFALVGWVSTQVELQEARRQYETCTRAHRTACTAESGRVQSLEQRLKLLRNYVDGYCRR